MAQSIVLVTGSRRGVKVNPNTLRVQATPAADKPFPVRPNKALLKTLEQLEDLWEVPFEEVRGQVASIVGDRMVEVLRELRENGREGTSVTGTAPPQLTLDQLADYFKTNPESFKKLVDLVEVKAEPKVESKVDTKVESKVDTKVESKVDTKVESKVDTKVESKVDTKVEVKARLSPIRMTSDRVTGSSPLEKFIAQMTKVEPEASQLAASTETAKMTAPTGATGFVDLADFNLDSVNTISSGESSGFDDKFEAVVILDSQAAVVETEPAEFKIIEATISTPVVADDTPPAPVITLPPLTTPIKILEPIPGTNKVKVSKLANK